MRNGYKILAHPDGTYNVRRGSSGYPFEKFVHAPPLPNGPVALAFVYAFGILCGTALTVHELGGDYRFGDFDTLDVRDHAGAIIFLQPEEVVGSAINWATGGNGFSHVVVYPAITDPDGEPLVVESREGRGVILSPLSKYDERPLAWLPLTPEETLHARGAALAVLGRPYRLRRGGMHCADLAYTCMPREMRRMIRESGEDISPNGLARALGLDAAKAMPIPAPARLANRLRLYGLNRSGSQ